MDIENIFVDSKWRMLTELSHASLSPTELAEKTGTSIANISSQIRLLEALDFVEKESLSNVNKGEPRKLYSLKKQFAYLVVGTRSMMGKKFFKLNDDSMIFFTILLINDTNVPNILMRFFLEHEDLHKESLGVAYLGLKGDEIELLVIHPDPEKIRQHDSIEYEKEGKRYHIKMHIYTKDQFEGAINMGEEHASSLLRRASILSSRVGCLSRLKKRREER